MTNPQRESAAAYAPSALMGAYEHAFNANDARAMNDLFADVAVAHSRQRSLAADGTLVETDADPMEAMFTVVLTMNGGPWRIRVGQNTPATCP
ncbi:hypothetical protein [Parafrankia sp. FMc2]|uniref:hypothetical protein n=1 Tax=Parafrankia sp. FMc2 TaxID=3233196 RepID=UPI0034D5D488